MIVRSADGFSAAWFHTCQIRWFNLFAQQNLVKILLLFQWIVHARNKINSEKKNCWHIFIEHVSFFLRFHDKSTLFENGAHELCSVSQRIEAEIIK